MKRFFSICIVGAVLVSIGACSGTRTQDIKSFKPQGSQFDVALSDGYKTLAFDEYAEGDYRDADYFARRSIDAGSAKTPQPVEIGARSLPSDKVGELSDARARLVTALNNGGGSIAPADMAEAQVMYECWMQEQEENWPFQQDQIDACRDKYYAAIGKVETAMAPPSAATGASDFLVFFDWDSDVLLPEAQSIVNQAAANAKSGGANRIIATGHTDTSGSAEYNMGLSLRRAEAVRNELVLSGIPESNIEIVARGETEPLVATPDGVREPQNRRVQIQIVTAGASADPSPSSDVKADASSAATDMASVKRDVAEVVTVQ